MSRSPGLGFFLFILLNATLFVRPAEIVPVLQAYPIYNVIILACLAVSSSAVLRQLTPRSLSMNPIAACALCFVGSVVLSQLSHFQFGPAINSGVELIKILLYFFLLVGFLDSFVRIRKFLLWLSLFIAVLSSLALLHYHDIVKNPALEALHQGQDEIDEETGQPVVLARLQSTGIYGNPNDLSRILVVGILLSVYFLGDRRLGMIRPLWLLPIALFGHALHLTHSRGGLLSLFGGLFALLYDRYGKMKTFLGSALILPVLLVAFSGRQTSMSTSEGTAQERIKLWNEGFVLFQKSPVFGIGMGQYGEEVGLAAHNSFVHCYVELGFIGGTFFFGMFYLLCRAFSTRNRDQATGLDPELIGLRPFLFALLTATVVGMMSSTRSYDISIYLIVGLCAAYLRLLSDRGHALLPPFDMKLVGRLVLPSSIALAALYTYVRLSTHY
jgi:putative inorganic carbon (hco3(-)) transporter